MVTFKLMFYACVIKSNRESKFSSRTFHVFNEAERCHRSQNTSNMLTFKVENRILIYMVQCYQYTVSNWYTYFNTRCSTH